MKQPAMMEKGIAKSSVLIIANFFQKVLLMLLPILFHVSIGIGNTFSQYCFQALKQTHG